MDKLRVHITYDNEITLKELIETLEILNKSLNDVMRLETKNNHIISKNNPVITSVDKGSIIFEMILSGMFGWGISKIMDFLVERVEDYIFIDKEFIDVDIFGLHIHITRNKKRK